MNRSNFYHFDDDDIALLDTADFRSPSLYATSFAQVSEKMGKNKRSALDLEEDSGYCNSNSTAPASKIAKLDEEVMLLRSLIKDAGHKEEPAFSFEQFSDSNMSPARGDQREANVRDFSAVYASKSRDGKYELRILNQPEDQHRARYLTEGSRGSIKDKSGLGHPVVKLEGPVSGSLKLECYIGHDKQIGMPHLFYQASKISGKNSTRCSTHKAEGVTVVRVELEPEHEMIATVDCIGILKERNVDVEQKLMRLKSKSGADGIPSVLPNKKRSTKCRIIFRVELPSGEMLQAVSSPILCTQPLGTPEISKKSLGEAPMTGGQEIFIIGKNFLKDSKVVWKSTNWSKIVEPDKEYLHSTHLVSTVPAYDGPEVAQSRVEVSFCIRSGGKYSDSHVFSYVQNLNCSEANADLQINRRQLQFGSSSSPFVLQKPMLTLFGSSTSTASSPDSLANGSSGYGSDQNNAPQRHGAFYANYGDYTSDVTSASEASMSPTTIGYSSSAETCQSLSFFSPTSVTSDCSQLSPPVQNHTTNPFSFFNSLDASLQSSDSMTQMPPPAQPSPRLPETVSFFENQLRTEVNKSNSSPDAIANSFPATSFSAVSLTSQPASSSQSPPPLPRAMPQSFGERPFSNLSAALLGHVPPQPQAPQVNGPGVGYQAQSINTLSQMSDSELLGLINPSTFDQCL